MSESIINIIRRGILEIEESSGQRPDRLYLSAEGIVEFDKAFDSVVGSTPRRMSLDGAWNPRREVYGVEVLVSGKLGDSEQRWEMPTDG